LIVETIAKIGHAYFMRIPTKPVTGFDFMSAVWPLVPQECGALHQFWRRLIASEAFSSTAQQRPSSVSVAVTRRGSRRDEYFAPSRQRQGLARPVANGRRLPSTDSITALIDDRSGSEQDKRLKLLKLGVREPR
jgi:hypothetical protein